MSTRSFPERPFGLFAQGFSKKEKLKIPILVKSETSEDNENNKNTEPLAMARSKAESFYGPGVVRFRPFRDLWAVLGEFLDYCMLG